MSMNILSSILLVTITFTIHELGHVLSAKLTGSKIDKIGLHWTGPYVQITIYPVNYLKAAFTCASGPLLNLLCFPLIFVPIHEFSMLGWINVLCGVGNLILPKSDGYQIYHLWRNREIKGV